MNKHNPSELVESWSSAPGRVNVMVVAPSDAGYLGPLLALDEDYREASGAAPGKRSEKPFEVLHVERPSDATKLLMRGRLSVVVLDASPVEPGFVEFLIAGLGKAEPPRILLLADSEPVGGDVQGAVRIVFKRLPGFRICEQVIRLAQDFEKGKAGVFAGDLLRGISAFPDEYWLRVSADAGQSADLCVAGGRAVYCEAGRLSGDNAAKALFSWGACSFEFREYPGFLRSNMDCRLSDVLSSGGKEASSGSQAPPAAKAPAEPPEKKPETNGSATRSVWWMPPATNGETMAASAGAGPGKAPVVDAPVQTPPAARLVSLPKPEAFEPPEADIEEPLDIPVLAGLVAEDKADPSALAGADLDFAEDPAEPVFDPTIPEPEILVEEPPDLYFAETPVGGIEEPMLPEFDGILTMPSPGESALRSEVFASFAVIQMAGWVAETVFPESANFDWEGLEDLFLHASDGADRNALGSMRRFMVIGETGAMVAAQVRNTDRVLVVRTRDRYFGELEESEWSRLLEAVAVTAPTPSA